MLRFDPGPRYTATEVAFDRALHIVAILLAVGGTLWLFLMVKPGGRPAQFLALTLYGAGLIGTFLASGVYNCWASPRRKELLRRIDHAMIFVMIAATVTPFALSAFPTPIGLTLFVLIWMVAAVGVMLKLAFPRRFERVLLALYLMMGWTVVGMGSIYADNLSQLALLLLLAGGVSYSLGTIVHSWGRYRFHNVAWHGLVTLGASAHWTAILDQIRNWHGRP